PHDCSTPNLSGHFFIPTDLDPESPGVQYEGAQGNRSTADGSFSSSVAVASVEMSGVWWLGRQGGEAGTQHFYHCRKFRRTAALQVVLMVCFRSSVYLGENMMNRVSPSRPHSWKRIWGTECAWELWEGCSLCPAPYNT
ncbi:hypothetical protein H1C71_024736, partial [Ictidomys tridecemlineatus]